MPLNLAQTAISVLRLGENALTAIYSGITRVYPNEVTVSIDGANASTQSGTPGQSMNNLIYTVNPSNGSTSGWTAAQISAATLTGLPAGFTATFSASGGLGSQVGTWTINTTDGLLPAVDTAIAVGSLTSTIAQTSWGSISVNMAGSNWNTASSTLSNFVGSGVGLSATQPTNYYTAVGQLWGSVSGISGSVSSGQGTTSISVSGVNSYRAVITCNWTIQSTGTASSSVSISGVPSNVIFTRVPIFEINAPPWSINPVQNMQFIVATYYGSSGAVIDSRWKVWVYADFTGGSGSGSGVSPYYAEQNRSPDGSKQLRSYQNYGGSGSGSYTVIMMSNQSISGAVWANDSTSRSYIEQSVTWNWT